MIASAIMWSCLAVVIIMSCSPAGACISNYQELRASLVSYPQNIDNLLMAFYPPNQSPSHALDVHYNILGGEGVNTTYQFRWVDSSVLLLVEVELLEALSLNMANLVVRNASIVLDPFCHEEMILDLLDLATIWLRSYSVGKQEIDRFYSLYYNVDEAKFVIRDDRNNIRRTVLALISFEYLAAGGALMVFYSLLAVSRWDNFQKVGKFFSDIAIPCMGIMLWITGKDVYAFSSKIHLSHDWLLAFPFPIVMSGSLLVNLIMSCLIVAHIDFHMPGVLVIFSFLPCSRYVQQCIKAIVQIILIFSVANLSVLFLFHFAWLALTFVAYPLRFIGSLVFAVPLLVVVFDLYFLLEFIADAQIMHHKFGNRAKKMVFCVVVVLLLAPMFISMFGVLYCYSSVVVNVGDSRDNLIASLTVRAAPSVIAAIVVWLANHAIKAAMSLEPKQADHTLLENEDD